MGHYQAPLNIAIEAAREAGEILREEFHRSGGPRGTLHHAEADEVAERVVRERLLAATPWDYLGEETGAALGAAALVKNPEERMESVARSARHSSQANGSLMRISPLGIFGWAEPASVVAWARRDSGLTHPNAVCRESCAVFVRAIAAALGRGDARSCYQAALEEGGRGGDTHVITATNALTLTALSMAAWGWLQSPRTGPWKSESSRRARRSPEASTSSIRRR